MVKYLKTFSLWSRITFYFSGEGSTREPETRSLGRESNTADIKPLVHVSLSLVHSVFTVWVCDRIPKMKLISHEICGKTGKVNYDAQRAPCSHSPLYHTHHRSTELKFSKIEAVSRTVLHQWAVISPRFSNQILASFSHYHFSQSQQLKINLLIFNMKYS